MNDDYVIVPSIFGLKEQNALLHQDNVWTVIHAFIVPTTPFHRNHFLLIQIFLEMLDYEINISTYFKLKAE